ncbi:MAG: hypothetical protein HY055_12705 [Magnetospirillum sp.]|nr:hypothetical protein [Magnetospirillum sp.]
MTKVSRNAAASALLDFLLAAPGLKDVIKTSGNHLIHWKDLQHQGHCPALFVPDTDSHPKGDWGSANAWHLDYEVWVYTYAGKADGSAQRARNDLIDAIDQAIRPDPIAKRCTLGGKVGDCRISGTVKTDGALLGAQSFALIPVTIRNI